MQSTFWVDWLKAVFFPTDRVALSSPLAASLPPRLNLDYLHELAIVQQAIHPNRRGRVSFRGSSWFALCKANIVLLPGRVVRVTGRYNTTLVVEPLPDLAH